MTFPEVTWTHPALSRILDLIPTEAASLLDVGCGRGIIGALCRIYRACARLVGVDIYRPYLEFCRRHALYDEVIEWDLRKTPLPFRTGEFDVATAIEVVEHLEKWEGEALLDELERVARTVIVTTPNRFFQQKAYDGNEWQRHRSIWSARELRARGYEIIGAGGLLIGGRRIRGVSTALQGFSRVMPAMAEFLLAVKRG
jgi:2-polyprenyl-3-methyl-5-hydroxy-6-metoxy-1,4-benzoquinol methylase